MSSGVAGSRTTPRPTCSPLNRPNSPFWSSGVGRTGGAAATFSASSSKSAAQKAGLNGEGMRLAGAVVLVDDHAGDADVAAELSEVLDRRADVVRDVEGLEVVRADHDDLLAHVAGDRQPEA